MGTCVAAAASQLSATEGPPEDPTLEVEAAASATSAPADPPQTWKAAVGLLKKLLKILSSDATSLAGLLQIPPRAALKAVQARSQWPSMASHVALETG